MPEPLTLPAYSTNGGVWANYAGVRVHAVRQARLHPGEKLRIPWQGGVYEYPPVPVLAEEIYALVEAEAKELGEKEAQAIQLRNTGWDENA